MKINGKAYCLFEQSGTFRDAFKRAGIPAVCVDADNFIHGFILGNENPIKNQ